ncbi:MAG: hypothetical protein ACFCVH_03855 [Alphaproteobacteria bacterium]
MRTLRMVAVLAALAISLAAAGHSAMAEQTPAMTDRFEELSTNGNSNCSAGFTDAIATMPAMSMLQGSCCSPMDLHRYLEQVAALAGYRDVAAIPPDPYNIPAGQAHRLMQYEDLELRPDEQSAYQYAMEKSDEKGPCCCQCWRWRVYGGLAKYLIREHGYTGDQIVEVWNLSNGCGGGSGHVHH